MGIKGDLRVPFCSLLILHMAKNRREWPKKITVGSVTVRVYEVAHVSNSTGKAYVLAYTTPTGRKTIKFADPLKAMDEARLQAGKLAAGKVEAADMTGGEREELLAARKMAGNMAVLSALREWQDARALCGGELLAAARFYCEHTQNSKRKTILIKDAVRLFLKAKMDEGINTKASYDKVLPRLQDGILGDLPIDSIGKDQLNDWMRTAYSVNGKPVNRVTFNTVKKRFVTLWKWARSEGYLPKLAQTAAQEIVSVKGSDEDDEAIGIMKVFGWRDALHLIKDEAPHLLANLVIGGFCGLRRCELMAQKWSDIDLVRGHLRVTKAKRRTPARRLVTLPKAAREWLRLCPKDNELIGPSWGIDHVRARIKAAGIDCPDNALRHSFITYLCAASGSVDKTAQAAGNSAKVVFAHYRELVTPQEGKAWASISPAAPATGGKVVQFKKQAAS